MQDGRGARVHLAKGKARAMALRKEQHEHVQEKTRKPV
jgi:hypothetical protein